MRITLALDEALIERVRELTGIKETEAVVRAGIEAFDHASQRREARSARRHTVIHPRVALRTRPTASRHPR